MRAQILIALLLGVSVLASVSIPVRTAHVHPAVRPANQPSQLALAR